MTIEHDSNTDDLDPRVLAAFVAVEPVDNALREAHIAAALAHTPALSRRAPHFLRIAAACVALLLAGGLVGRFVSPSKPAQNATTVEPTTRVKNGGITSTHCSSPSTDAQYVGSYSIAGAIRVIFVNPRTIQIWDEATCTLITTISHLPTTQP